MQLFIEIYEYINGNIVSRQTSIHFVVPIQTKIDYTRQKQYDHLYSSTQFDLS